MRKILTNKEMASAFGGYDFRTSDMRKVCQAQRELTLKESPKVSGKPPIIDILGLTQNKSLEFAIIEALKAQRDADINWFNGSRNKGQIDD